MVQSDHEANAGAAVSGRAFTQAEAALRRSQAMLERTEALAQVGSWEWEVATDAVSWSPGLFRLLGRDIADGTVSFAEHASLYLPEDMARLERAVAAAVRDGTPYELELCAVRADGVTRTCLVHGRAELGPDGSAVRLFGSMQDITERKRVEEALALKTAKLSAIFNGSPAGITVSSLVDGELLEVNDSALRMYGYSREEVVGRTVGALGTYANPAQREELVRQLREKRSVDDFPVDFRRRTGDVGVLEISGRLIDLHGTPCLVAMLVDVTARKRAEQERAKLEAQLHQAQKMESVGRLAGGVAHDFNNMLGVILGHVEVALDYQGLDPTLRDDLEEIRKAARRSADLTGQLLAFARKQVVTPRVLDLRETVTGTLTMLRRLIGENITLEWQPDSSPCPVRVDPSQIDQVLTNLCVNARDAISGIGKLTIETSPVRFDEADCALHRGTLPGDFIRLVVRDDGCGMDRETQAHLFEPFFTTKPMGTGTGLGLATIYGIVRQNGGFIAVDSEVGRGTTFTLYFPRHQTAPRPESVQRAAGHDGVGRETVLLVEDEAAILRVTRRMLEKMGYIVLAAGTPGEAIRLAESHPTEIQLLMTDVVMPEMNGRDLAKQLLSRSPGLKRLFMSGYTADVIAHHGVLSDGVNFLQKPFSRADLDAAVRQALGRDPAA